MDIWFEGTIQSFDYLNGAFKYYLSDRDIVCNLGVTRIVVVGKSKVGKTCLIEGMERLQKYRYSIEDYPCYLRYIDDGNHAEWYEIKGIDLGMENVEKAYSTVSSLIEKGISSL